MWWGRSKVPRQSPWDLSTPILWFSDSSAWTIGDACQNTQIWGSTGSGKTSGSLAAICDALLRVGFGGLFLTTKPDDRQTYERYCRRAGRLNDLVIFGIGTGLCFNPLDAELHRKDAGGGLTENIKELLCTLPEVRRRRGQSAGRQDDSGYWQDTFHQLVRNSVDLLVMAQGRLNIPDLYRLVTSAPVSLKQADSEEWQQWSFCYQSLVSADRKERDGNRRKDLKIVRDFFLEELAGLAEKTRSIVVSTFSSTLDVLNRGPIRDLVNGESNISPEIAQDGKIILLDLPIKVYGEVGAFIQVLWKYCFQRAQERRDIAANSRPTFIVSDESHLLVVSSDQEFASTCRSSRTALVLATQSISNYLAALGGEKAEPQVHSLLGNCQTQVFHQQADIKTNAYAAELIGRSRQYLTNASNAYQPGDWLGSLIGQSTGQTSAGVSECFEWEVQPNVFSRLRKGGPPEWIVDAIVYQGGRRFSSTGRPWMRAAFRQQL